MENKRVIVIYTTDALQETSEASEMSETFEAAPIAFLATCRVS